jgi:ABC-type branched-subunit amino acid transport system substrate-binding protein
LSKVIAIGVSALLASSCSLSLPERQECQADSECVDAFGAGHSCGGDGYCRLPAACASNADCQQEEGFGYVCGEEERCELMTAHPRCTKTIPERLFVPDEFPDAIVFGSVIERAYEGDAVLERAAELAVVEANDAGGLDGRTFGMVFCTDEENAEYDSLTPDDGASDVAVASWLVETAGVAAVFGPTTSARSEAVFEALRGTGTLFISPSATSATLTALDNARPSDNTPGLLWRTVPPDSLQGRTMATDMLAREVGSVAVIAEAGTYGEGLADVFVDAFTEMGGSVVGEVRTYGNPSALADHVVAVAGTAADEVLFISGLIEDERRFLNAAASQSGFDTKGIFLSDTAATTDLLVDTPGGLYARIRLTRPAVGSGDTYNQFVAAYSQRFPGQNPRQFGFVAQAYDAAWLLLYGSAWSLFGEGEVTGLGIGRGMRRLSSGTELPIRGSTWDTARGALIGGKSIDVVGASGDLDFNPETEETEAGIEVVVLSDCGGDWEFVLVPPGMTVECP